MVNNIFIALKIKDLVCLPFADKFQRCMKLPHEGDIVGNFLVKSIKVNHRNLFDGVYSYPVEIVVIGEGGKQGVSRTFKPFFNKVISLFSGFGALYQCRGGKLEIETVAPKTYKIVTTGIGCRIYPKQELEAFMQFLKDSTGLSELNSDVIITTYLEYYQKILQC